MTFLTYKHKKLLSTKAFYKGNVNISLPFLTAFMLTALHLHVSTGRSKSKSGNKQSS
jgi:hypothetical protein